MKEIIGVALIFVVLALCGFSRIESDAELVARYSRPSTTVLLPLGRVAPAQKVKTIDEIVTEAADTIGIRENLLRGMIKVESDWDSKARREEPKIKTRSRGLTQVLETTAAIYGVKPHELEDPETSIWTGGLYLRDMIKHEKGSEFWGVVAYNAGPKKSRALYPKSAIVHARKVIAAAKG